ncbi:hypothetical protein R50073_15110 [Maricurvus nonylphenolicus]|uniref:lipoyl domain-containing protein n=1 Tax=Maricurvus nonylphenolicus TaxID=1008307 RepID=UPI0036F40623
MAEITLNGEAWEGVEAGTEALLDEWLVAEGDTVEAGQVIARVVLVKANHEIEAPVGGTVSAITVTEEAYFVEGTVLATIG